MKQRIRLATKAYSELHKSGKLRKAVKGLHAVYNRIVALGVDPYDAVHVISMEIGFYNACCVAKDSFIMKSASRNAKRRKRSVS
jgi:hypothetical protein